MSASAVKEGAGARTQITNLVAWVVTIITLLFLTPLFAPLPEAVLAALIIHAVWHIIASRKLQKLRQAAPVEFWFGVLALAGVLLIDVMQGMMIGLVGSLLFVIYYSSRPHISPLGKVPGVTKVKYVSSGQAREQFAKDDDPNGALAALPAEAFPASIELEVRSDVTDDALTDMVTKLQRLPAVDDVETYQAWTTRLARLVRGGVAASAVLAVVVLLSVLAVVGSTMRFALQRRRGEVEVLRLVGATDRFVKAPFLIEGSLQGALGAAFAVVLLGFLFVLVRGRLDGDLALLIGVEPSFLPWQFVLGMVALGGVLGATAAALGLRRLVTV